MPSRKPKLKQRKPRGEEAVGDIEDLFNLEEAQKIRVSLLDWYDKNQRDLPWRRTGKTRETNGLNGYVAGEGEEEEHSGERRAYEVWVSEVMLQQTRVQAVIEYYNRWMRKWPTIHDLSQATLEEVNEMWAGLGYYRRARFLLEGARMIVNEENGFPNTASALREVKGIGDYTAGAIASIAFKEAVPVVDGNVVRVLARLKAVSANPKDRASIQNFWKLAAQLVDPIRPGDFNQSLMELGATLCTPLNPSCSSCPISYHCHAYSTSKKDASVVVTDYPTRALKAKQKHDFCYVCVVELLTMETENSDGKFILVKRPDEGLLAGLWEFPSVTLNEAADLATRRKKIDHYLKKTFQLEPKLTCSVVLREDVGDFVHVFTHIRRKMYVELLVLYLKGSMDEFSSKKPNQPILWKCVGGDVLAGMGLTSAVRKVHSMVQKFKQDLAAATGTRSKTTNSKKRKL